MSEPISYLPKLLSSMEPVLNDGVYVFSSVPHDANITTPAAIATFRENEGITVVIEEERARRSGLPVLFRAAWITLTVRSDLQAVGLTAAFAAALDEANISCNVIAGAFHDHIFVPVESAQEAMAALRGLQQGSSKVPG